jgi:pantoate--beta-alanine ligase
MSSRNKHLSEKERKDALALYRSLQKCEEILKSGENKAEKIIAEMTSVIKSGNPTKIDYISVVNYEDLQPVSYIQSKV